MSLAKAARIHTKKPVRRATSADNTDISIAELKQMIEMLGLQVQELSASIARRSDEWTNERMVVESRVSESGGSQER